MTASDLNGVVMLNVCSIEGCGSLSEKRGLCNKHYLRQYRNGTTERIRKVGRSVCSIDGCNSASHSDGWCLKHYCRWRRTGDPEKVITTETGEPHRYFKDVVLKFDGDDCLEWPFGIGQKGYGMLWNGKRPVGVHVLVCEHFYGKRPEAAHAAHACGNSKCCNWKHVRWASPSENNRDKKEHGTSQAGERNGNSRLTEKQVRKIKEMKGRLSQNEIAKMFSVSQKTIWMIFNEHSWSHIH